MTQFRLARFTADVTIPLGHRCMGILPRKSERIIDPLEVHGFVFLGAGDPIVLVAVDWCEIRNGAYERWREVLAQAAGTTRSRVLVTSLHQHDAPISDLGADNLLAKVGLAGEMFDSEFHEKGVQRVAGKLRESLQSAQPVTQIGLGAAKVKQIASNRRVVSEEGTASYSRGSNSGGNTALANAPEGLIDPYLKTISFWDREEPLLALSAYATHPMSYYGRGEVSADFVGMARRQRQRDLPTVQQVYVSGCSGDVTAGKYNDGSPANRSLLTHRLHAGMKQAWDATERHALERVDFRVVPLVLEYRGGDSHTTASLTNVLENKEVSLRDRILAAMSLSSRRRVASGQTIDFPCIDFGPAQVVLFPGESFVAYQLMAQQMRPDSFVMSIGYGECWPGYIPSAEAFRDGFENTWLWVAPGAQKRIRRALEQVLPETGR
jgi:hypothetical protein